MNFEKKFKRQSLLRTNHKNLFLPKKRKPSALSVNLLNTFVFPMFDYRMTFYKCLLHFTVARETDKKITFHFFSTTFYKKKTLFNCVSFFGYHFFN